MLLLSNFIFLQHRKEEKNPMCKLRVQYFKNVIFKNCKTQLHCKEWVKCGMQAVPAGMLKFITASANVQILWC